MAEGRVSLGNPLPFAMGAFREGLSATEALGAVRDAGLAISNERWYSAFRTAQEASDLGAGLANFANDVPLPVEAHAAWEAGVADTYAYRVEMHAIDLETGLTVRVPQMVTSDVPLSPGEAAAQIYDEWADPDSTNAYELQPIGAQLVGAYRMTGRLA